jgi:hypothetical protein
MASSIAFEAAVSASTSSGCARASAEVIAPARPVSSTKAR